MKKKKCVWISSSGKLEFVIKEEDAAIIDHPGDALNDLRILRNNKEIEDQLQNFDPKIVKEELKEIGAWDNEELMDHNFNLTRLLWIICCDVNEGAYL